MPVGGEQRDVQHERARLEHEEVQPLGHAGHRAQDAVEDDGEDAAERQRRRPPTPTSSADSHSRFAAIRRRGNPSARSAATSPSRWLTDTVSSVATSRNANASVIVDSTTEICRK